MYSTERTITTNGSTGTTAHQRKERERVRKARNSSARLLVAGDTILEEANRELRAAMKNKDFG